MGQCKSGGKDFKRDYAKEQLRENMGQWESKERDFKKQKRIECLPSNCKTLSLNSSSTKKIKINKITRAKK
jgi:hypothetical protein